MATRLAKESPNPWVHRDWRYHSSDVLDRNLAATHDTSKANPQSTRTTVCWSIIYPHNTEAPTKNPEPPASRSSKRLLSVNLVLGPKKKMPGSAGQNSVVTTTLLVHNICNPSLAVTVTYVKVSVPPSHVHRSPGAALLAVLVEPCHHIQVPVLGRLVHRLRSNNNRQRNRSKKTKRSSITWSQNTTGSMHVHSSQGNKTKHKQRVPQVAAGAQHHRPAAATT